MPVSLCEWRVRIGTFVRRKKKEHDYNHLLRELLNFMKKTENSRTAKDNKTSESKTASHTGSSDSSSGSQYGHDDFSSKTEPSCDVSSPVNDGALHLKPSCDVSSPIGDAAVHLRSSCDVDSPGIHTVTESQSHVNISDCNAQSLHADGSKDTNHESGLTCKEEDAAEDSDCPDVNNMLILRSGDVECNPGPNDTPGNLTELELYLLAEDMDPSDFRKVGLALGFSEARLRSFEKDHQACSIHAAYQMLYEWRKTVHDSKAREILVSKFEHTQMMKLADSLRRGQVGEHIPTLTEEEISRVAEDVKHYLFFELCHIQADPLNSELLLQFERIFTNLTLMEEDKGTKHKTPLLYDNLLKTKVNGFYPKRLLVEGEGGVGKTTLCAKIAWDWIHGVGYEDFKLVLVILLRKATDRTVGEIVKSYLSDDNPVTAKQLDKYILTHPDEVFLVLDGLDDLAVDLSSTQQLIQITLNRLFKSGTVLITSRQWRSDEIRKNPDLRKVFAFIAVEGFSTENLASYITKFFHPDKASSEDLNRFIADNDVIRENMAPFPIYTAMLCIMWKEFDGVRRQAMRKLLTFSQLFDEMIGFLVDHYLSKSTPSDMSGNGEFHSEIRDHLTSIGCVAFQGLQDRRLVFTEEEFQGCPESVNIGCKVGVLTKEKRILSKQERKNYSPSTVSLVQFPQKLFQEYLSGMYLASLYNSNRGEYERLTADITKRPGEYQYLLYFMSAQQEEVGLDIASRLIVQRSYRGGDFIVDVAYESQNPAVAKVVADHLKSRHGRTLEIREKMQTHTVLGHLFVVDHREVDELNIEKSCGRTTSKDLAEFMCTSPSLRSVTIRGAMHDVFYYVIANQAVHSKTETLHIECEDLIERPYASRDLAQFIYKMPHLKTLTLNTACHEDFYSTSASMASSSKIETLDVRCDDLIARPSASQDLAQFICKMPHLKTLMLNTACHDDFYSASATMATSAKIETLDVRYTDLRERPSASRDLAQFIFKMPHLKTLTLNTACHDDFYSISASMASYAKIETLDVRCDDLIERPSASQDLAQFIFKMPHLKNLMLNGECHNHFYSASASMVTSAKIETLNIMYTNLRECPSASHNLAQFICKMPHLKNLTLGKDDLICLHNDFYSTSASMASYAEIETLDVRCDDLIERPSASRDLAQFICKMPHLKNLTLNGECHVDFYSTSASMASSAEIETLDVKYTDLRERPSASRDLAQFICKMPHLKTLTLNTACHDDFYSISASMASFSKIETLDVRCDDLIERPSASRDLAQFICKMPHLKNLMLYAKCHDDFYSTSVSMAFSKIETLDVRCDDLIERPSASRDLAQFICKMPHLKNLMLYAKCHDDFYSTSVSMASFSKIETLDVRCDDLIERPSASRDLAQFICKMPHLKNLMLYAKCHDDFYSTSVSMASSAKGFPQVKNGNFRLNGVLQEDLNSFLCSLESLESGSFDQLSAPPEILARGPEAIKAYTSALKDGKKKVFRTRLMLVGQEGVGKTSLKKSLTRQGFDPKEAMTDGAETEDICEISIEHIRFDKDDEISWSVKQEGNTDDPVGEFERVLVDHMVSTLRENASKEQASSEVSREPGSNESDDRHQGEAGAHGEKIPDGVTQNKATTSQFDFKETTDTRMYGDKTVGVESTAVPPSKDERSKMETTEAPKASEAPEAPRETGKDEGLPDGVAEQVEERLKVEGAESGNDEGKDRASLNIWDFAGHDVYYTTHQVFLTWRAIYVIVFDLSTDLDSVVPPECRNRCYQIAKQGTKSELTCLEFIEFWLFSIYTHAVRPSSEYSDSTKKTDQKSPPIFIVGTHRDEVEKESEGDRQEKRKEKINAAFDRIRTIIKGKLFECHMINRYYQIENSLEGDKELDDLRKRIEDVAKEEPYMGEEIPLRWLKFEEFHATNKKKGKNCMTLDEIKEHTQEIGIESEEELLTMLNFYHDLGSIIYYGDVKESKSLLRDIVILSPQWLINVFKQVITVLEYSKRDGIVSDAWSTLEEHGILEDRLIQHMWQKFQEKKDALVELMMKFDLICKAPANWFQQEEVCYEVSDETAKSPEKIYYVPSRLPQSCKQKDTSQVNLKSSVEFYIDFHGFLPEGLFHRLMARVAEWKMNRNEVRLFYRQISMTVDDEHEALVTMLPPRDAAIKVTVFRARIIPLKAASHCQSVPQTPDPQTVKQVRDFITKTLDSLIQLTARKLKFDIGFTCPECSSRKFFKDCLQSKLVLCGDHRIPGEILIEFGYGKKIEAWETNVLDSTSSREREGINSVTQEQLDKIAWKFPHAQYYSFCNKLGTEFYEAQKILAKNMKDYHKALMEVLMAWKTRTGGPYSVLEAALRDSEAGALVAHIEPGTSQCTSTSNAVYALRERSDERSTGAVRKRTGAQVHSSTDLQPANIPVMQQPEPQVEVPPRLKDKRQEKECSIILIILIILIIAVIFFVLFIFLPPWYTGFTFM